MTTTCTTENSYLIKNGVNVAVYTNGALTVVEVTESITGVECDALEVAYKEKYPSSFISVEENERSVSPSCVRLHHVNKRGIRVRTEVKEVALFVPAY